jgi:hypothetical protein
MIQYKEVNIFTEMPPYSLHPNKIQKISRIFSPQNFFLFFIVLLFICAYKAWVISPPCPHPLLYHPLCPLLLPPIPSIPSRNYFALISNFVEERV